MIQYNDIILGNGDDSNFKKVYFLNTFSNTPALFVAPCEVGGSGTPSSTYINPDSSNNVKVSALISYKNTSYFNIGFGDRTILFESSAGLSWLAIGI